MAFCSSSSSKGSDAICWYKDRRWDGTLTGFPVEWANFLGDYFINVLGDEKYITWHSDPNAGILDDTDHELLGFSFQSLDANDRGPGSGKANPFLAGSKALAEFLIGSEKGLSAIKRFSTPQQQWD
ncbi:hypothetical protein HMPREF1544_03491 [Mucor circinelloides 1006PhL]|uniref:Uncharacterized protein n=1 Tax=Mucor circinelloides f. circinelloides (strain 1006PhL) TaxID=1220926 RepID=S2JH84_MUCC1|nr:hypothetical protein HMPREF1544_03491 [Mucor circinelloides 1006PhL]